MGVQNMEPESNKDRAKLDLHVTGRMVRTWASKTWNQNQTKIVPNSILEVWPESHWPGFALRQADVFQSYTKVCNTFPNCYIDNRRYDGLGRIGVSVRFLGRNTIQRHSDCTLALYKRLFPTLYGLTAKPIQDYPCRSRILVLPKRTSFYPSKDTFASTVTYWGSLLIWSRAETTTSLTFTERR